MTAVRITNDLLRFSLELLALVVLFGWGAHTVDGTGRWAMGLFTMLAGAAFWGWWLAPKAAHRLQDPIRLAVELGFFTVVALAIAPLRSPLAAATFLSIAVGNALVMRLPSLHLAVDGSRVPREDEVNERRRRSSPAIGHGPRGRRS